MKRVSPITQLLVFACLVTTAIAGQSPAGIPEAVRTPTRASGVDDVADVAVGDHFFVVARSNLALTRDGHLVAWGSVFLAP